MNADQELDPQQPHGVPEKTDAEQKVFGFGTGGVPWYLLLFYLGFLVFFTWYVLEYQLPDFLNQGPTRGGESPVVNIP
jgi:hypothetical protein